MPDSCVKLPRNTDAERCDILNHTEFTVISLSSLLTEYGETVVSEILKDFEPYADTSTSEFLKEKSDSYGEARFIQDLHRFDDSDKSILGYVSIGMKCIRIPKENLLSRNLLRQCNIDDSIGVAQAYLLGQLARSRCSPKGFGDALIDFAVGKIREAKQIVGCRVLRLDCSDELLSYYEKHGFTQIRKNPDKDLNQMMIIV